MKNSLWCLILALLFAGGHTVEAKRLTQSELKEVGLLAIQDDGRRKPFDTFANESALHLTGRYTVKAFGQKWLPIDFVLSAMMEDRDWRNEPILLVSSHAFRVKAGLDPQRDHFSLEELGKSEGLKALAMTAHQKGVAEEKLDSTDQEAQTVSGRIGLWQKILTGNSLVIVPPSTDPNEAWVLPPDFSKFYTEAQFAPAMEHLRAMASAYIAADGFNVSKSARALRESLRSLSPQIYPSEEELQLEYTYNHLQAVKVAAFLFIIGSLLIAAAMFAESRGFTSAKFLRFGAVLSAVVGVGLETAGIVMRCLIAGRPPVTNMYESVIWVSFVVGVLGLIFYCIYRSDLYLLASMPMSAISVLLVLQMPSVMPAHIDPLVPVLRDNFWLTIHVLTIVMGYGAFALAMAFAHIILGMYLIKPTDTRDNLALHFWLYRVLQLGVLLLGAGTILGGVWANYSWGRFWGWDPKETWALIALLSYIIAIHGRIAGWWGHFGMAVASVICFLSIIMCWYGVNYVLGAGLHSYGFGTGGKEYIYTAVGVDLLFVGIASYRYLRAQGLERAMKEQKLKQASSPSSSGEATASPV